MPINFVQRLQLIPNLERRSVSGRNLKDLMPVNLTLTPTVARSHGVYMVRLLLSYISREATLPKFLVKNQVREIQIQVLTCRISDHSVGR
jgi:hypothetical protein